MQKLFKKILTFLLLTVVVILTLNDACLESESLATMQNNISILSQSNSSLGVDVFENNTEIPCAHACPSQAPDICCAGMIDFEAPILNIASISALKMTYDYNAFYQLVFLNIPTPPPTLIS